VSELAEPAQICTPFARLRESRLAVGIPDDARPIDRHDVDVAASPTRR
jgi:hypothetical protein